MEPVGSTANLYARYGLLPPSGFLTLPGVASQVQFIVRATGRGSVTVFVDPTIETGLAAGNMNVLQAVLNVLQG